jgi:hypothetical protein
MKSFLAACAAAILIAIAASVILNSVQKPVSVAYTTTGARI